MLTLKSVSNFFHCFLGKREVLKQIADSPSILNMGCIELDCFVAYKLTFENGHRRASQPRTQYEFCQYTCDIIGDLHLSLGGVSCCLVRIARDQRLGITQITTCVPPSFQFTLPYNTLASCLPSAEQIKHTGPAEKI